MISTATIPRKTLARDDAVPQRDFLLSENLMGPRLSAGICGFRLAKAEECRIERAKYRFGKSLRVVYGVQVGGEILKISARTFDENRLTELQSARRTQEIVVARTMADFFDDELRAAFWVFPNDRKITNLGVLTRVPEDLSKVTNGLWKRSFITAYAPEKCATAKCLDENGQAIAYAKIFAGDNGREIFGTYEKFKSSNVRLPRALSYSEARRTLILEAIPGRRLADVSYEDSSGAYAKFGAEVAKFHQVKPTDDMRLFNRLDPFEISAVSQTLTRAFPDLAFQTAKVFDKLSAYPYHQTQNVCLHGDLHAKNAIWNGREITLIDLDQVSAGDVALDIGSFLAGLRYKECVGQLSIKPYINISKEFLRGYSSVRPLPSEGVLRRSTAAALLVERAFRAVTRYRIEGLENMRRILSVAGEILDGGDL